MVKRKRWKNGDVFAVPLKYFNGVYVYCKIIDFRCYPSLLEAGYMVDIRLIVFNCFTKEITPDVKLNLDDLYCNYLRAFSQDGKSIPNGWQIIRNDTVSHLELIDMDFRTDGHRRIGEKDISYFKSESSRINVTRLTELKNILHLELGTDWNLQFLELRIYVELLKKNDLNIPLKIQESNIWNDLVHFYQDAPHFFDIPVEKRFRAVCDWTEFVP